jgi:hypothetical protein
MSRETAAIEPANSTRTGSSFKKGSSVSGTKCGRTGETNSIDRTNFALQCRGEQLMRRVN